MDVNIESLILENVTFGYEGHAPVFENLSFSVPSSPLLWLHGSQGMGKSSLLKILAGLLLPTSGHYWINDQDVFQMSFTEFLPYRLRMGYSFDTGGLLSNRTLYENLMLPLMFHQRCSHEEADSRVKFWMNRFGISKAADKRPFAVTGSQRKATVLIRAFIHYPQIVFIDDAIDGLKEEGEGAFSDLVETCVLEHGLKHVLFCGEQELPVKTMKTKKLELSYQARAA